MWRAPPDPACSHDFVWEYEPLPAEAPRHFFLCEGWRRVGTIAVDTQLELDSNSQSDPADEAYAKRLESNRAWTIIGVLLAIGIPAWQRGQIVIGGLCMTAALGAIAWAIVAVLRSRGG